jgi:hypothetical protein
MHPNRPDDHASSGFVHDGTIVGEISIGIVRQFKHQAVELIEVAAAATEEGADNVEGCTCKKRRYYSLTAEQAHWNSL